MAKDHIRYDLLVQDAFRDLFRKVLKDAAANGLPGEHHFYITFRTGAPGVKISERLRAQYPDQMTIILQHQFWDLKVDEAGFEVGLSFRQAPEKLSVPFSAVSGFFDPSVNFGAEFTVEGEEAPAPPSRTSLEAPPAAATEKATVAPAEKPAPEKAGAAPAAKSDARPQSGRPRGAGAEPDETPAQPNRDEAKAPAGETPKVVSIDAFRKKNT